MSDTPRTDIEVEQWVLECKNQPHTDWVTAFFARQLERELNAANDRINGLKVELQIAKQGEMTEEKAREVLWDVEWAFSDGVAWLNHTGYTPLQLRAIAWWMDNMGGVR